MKKDIYPFCSYLDLSTNNSRFVECKLSSKHKNFTYYCNVLLITWSNFINYFVIIFQNVKINIIEAKFFENITITAKKSKEEIGKTEFIRMLDEHKSK